MSCETPKFSPYFFFKPFSAENLFSGLSPRAQKSLGKLKTRRIVKKDKVIFTDGDHFDVCIMCRGQAQLILYAAAFGEDSVRLVKANEVFGLTEAIADFPYQMSVLTITPCTIETIPRREFLDLLATEPEICDRLLQILAEDLQRQGLIFSSTTF
jgi:CRP-like cAMP-binding protein